jgi:DNA-binding response OmpR family regulator
MAMKILIVDDEKDTVELLAFRLKANNYEVVIAYDGREALEKIKVENPDLILLDITMSVMDGFEVLRRLRNDLSTRYTPVIMLTGRIESAAIFKAEDLGSTGYLMKPIDIDELLKLIKQYI